MSFPYSKTVIFFPISSIPPNGIIFKFSFLNEKSSFIAIGASAFFATTGFLLFFITVGFKFSFFFTLFVFLMDFYKNINY